jgi:hypothetical protein
MSSSTSSSSLSFLLPPSNILIPPLSRRDTQANTQETRLLVTLSKFHTLKESTLPSLLSSASKQLDADLSNDRETLLQVIDNMDQLVFEEFIKKRSRGLVDVMENGILRGGVDWLNAGKPTGESRARARGASGASAESSFPHGRVERVRCISGHKKGTMKGEKRRKGRS